MPELTPLTQRATGAPQRNFALEPAGPAVYNATCPALPAHHRRPPPPMNHDAYTDAYLRDVLGDVRSIAIVGLSAKWNRPSYFVAKYLQAKGYRVLPVNPREAGGEILGVPVAGSIGDLGETPDLVDVFRNSAAAGPITDEAVAAGAKAVWMQIGVRNDEAAARAEAAGLRIVMNRCPKIEYSRLYGELSWGGFYSGVITAKRRRARLS